MPGFWENFFGQAQQNLPTGQGLMGMLMQKNQQQRNDVLQDEKQRRDTLTSMISGLSNKPGVDIGGLLGVAAPHLPEGAGAALQQTMAGYKEPETEQQRKARIDEGAQRIVNLGPRGAIAVGGVPTPEAQVVVDQYGQEAYTQGFAILKGKEEKASREQVADAAARREEQRAQQRVQFEERRVQLAEGAAQLARDRSAAAAQASGVKLSADAQKRLEATNTMTSMVDEALAMLEESAVIKDFMGGTTAARWRRLTTAERGGILLSEPPQEVVDFMALLGNIVDKEARSRTGAQMPKNEEEFYNNLLGGDLSINPASLRTRLSRLRKLMDTNKESILGAAAAGAPGMETTLPGGVEAREVGQVGELKERALANDGDALEQLKTLSATSDLALSALEEVVDQLEQ